MASHDNARQGDEEERNSKNKREENVDLLYAILKVDRTASLSEIQNSYKRLTRSVHPDKIQQQAQSSQQSQQVDDNKEHAENCFVLVKQAHDVLTDPVYRFAYNHGGLLAVELVKRSQQVYAASAKRKRRESSSSSHHANTTDRDAGAHLEDDDYNDDSDDDGDEYDDEEYYEHHPNLYKRLEYAKSKNDAIQMIENVLQEYHLYLWASKQTPLEASVDMHQVYHHDTDTDDEAFLFSRLQSEATSSMSIQTQRSLMKQPQQLDCSLSWNGHVDRSGATDFSTRLGIGYRPWPMPVAASGAGGPDQAAAAAAAAAAASTFYAMDISLNQGASHLAALEDQRQERQQKRKQQQQQQQQGNLQQLQQQQQQQLAALQQQRPPVHFAFQTSRRFHDKTLVQVAVGGSSLKSLQSWSYSLSSSRVIVLGSWSNRSSMNRNDNDDNNNKQQDDDVHLHASWQMAFALARPTSIHALVGTIRNVTFPQYKLRISPLSLLLLQPMSSSSSSASSPALKLTIESASANAWHLAMSWYHWWCWRIKLTKEQPLSQLFSWTSSKRRKQQQQQQRDSNVGSTDEKEPHQYDDWLIKYGFRFDFRDWVTGALGNRNHWTLLLQLHSAANNAWNIRIPIDVLQYSSVAASTDRLMPPIVSTWIAFLLGQWLDEFIETTWMLQRKRKWLQTKKSTTTCLSTTPRAVQEKATTALLSNTSTDTARSLHHPPQTMASPPRFVETIRQIAAKKRQLEKENPNGKCLVILQATIWKSPLSISNGDGDGDLVVDHYYLEDDTHYLQQENVTDLLQFWVVDSQLPRLYIWNSNRNSSNTSFLTTTTKRHHGGEQWWRDWLCCNNTNMSDGNGKNDDPRVHPRRIIAGRHRLQDKVMYYYSRMVHAFYEQGYRQYLLPFFQRARGGDSNNNKGLPNEQARNNNNNNKTVMAVMPVVTAPQRLYVRYQYEGNVYEIEFSSPDDCHKDDDKEDHATDKMMKDDAAVWLPHPRAALMGSASRVQ